MERLSRVQLLSEGVEEIQETRVDRLDFTGAMVPQDVVDFPQRLPVVSPPGPVHHLQTLLGVGMEEGEGLGGFLGPQDVSRGPGGQGYGGRAGCGPHQEPASAECRKVFLFHRFLPGHAVPCP